MPKSAGIAPDFVLQDLMARWPATVEVFVRHRMLCVGCLVTPFHTIEDACAEYNLDQSAFIRELSDAITAAQHPDT